MMALRCTALARAVCQTCRLLTCTPARRSTCSWACTTTAPTTPPPAPAWATTRGRATGRPSWVRACLARRRCHRQLRRRCQACTPQRVACRPHSHAARCCLCALPAGVGYYKPITQFSKVRTLVFLRFLLLLTAGAVSAIWYATAAAAAPCSHTADPPPAPLQGEYLNANEPQVRAGGQASPRGTPGDHRAFRPPPSCRLVAAPAALAPPAAHARCSPLRPAQDDFAVISDHIPYIPDDVSDTLAAATPLPAGGWQLPQDAGCSCCGCGSQQAWGQPPSAAGAAL